MTRDLRPQELAVCREVLVKAGAVRGVGSVHDCDPTCPHQTTTESTPKALALLACIIATIFALLWVIA